jgi:hypothetical protein
MTVQQIGKLVEEDDAVFIFQSLGDVTNAAGYLPQILKLGVRWRPSPPPEIPHRRKERL